jgi:hypothetical protein
MHLFHLHIYIDKKNGSIIPLTCRLVGGHAASRNVAPVRLCRYALHWHNVALVSWTCAGVGCSPAECVNCRASRFSRLPNPEGMLLMRHDLHDSLTVPRLFAVVLWKGHDADAQTAFEGADNGGHLWNNRVFNQAYTSTYERVD